MKKLLIGLTLLASMSSFATSELASCISDTSHLMDGRSSWGVSRSQVLEICKQGIQHCAVTLYNNLSGGSSWGIEPSEALSACKENSTPAFLSCAVTLYKELDGGSAWGAPSEAINVCRTIR